MSLPPRAVVVYRRTELAELLARHGTRGQAAFFLSTRGRRLEDVEAGDAAVTAALQQVAAAIPPDWRRGSVEREDLPRFLFAPEDVVVVVGQDGLVANVAKYLDGQPVIGIDPSPGFGPGVLVPHHARDAGHLLRAALHRTTLERRAMVEAVTDDGQRLVALNEVYVGCATHQTARYTLTPPSTGAERQASSGVVVSTGTGATGWCRSLWQERGSALALPGPAETRLAWFVREAWPSPTTGTACVEGSLADGGVLTLDVETDRLVAFGDGMETDALELTWGQRVRVGLAEQQLHLVSR